MSVTFKSAPNTFKRDELENPQNQPENDENLKRLRECQWSTAE